MNHKHLPAPSGHLSSGDSPVDAAPAGISRRHWLAAVSGVIAAPALLTPRSGWSAQATAASHELVHSFTGGRGGSNPASLMFKSDGVLYGITESGGAGGGRGTIFRIRGGVFDIAHPFGPGEAPVGGVDSGVLDPLAEGPGGELYGTTFNGGNFQKGLAYKLNADDQLVQLHHFTGGEIDGMSPNEQMVVGPDGAMYGTGAMVVGGWNEWPQIYRMALDGTVSRVAQVGSWLNGLSKPLLASDGQFYTMSMYGGNFSHGGANRIATDGTVTSVYSVRFVRPSMEPSGGFVQHADGLLYGTSESDPEDQQRGTIFSMTLDGKVKILHRFSGVGGSRPFGLIAGSDGMLYGVARSGGPANRGGVFQFAPATRQFTLLHAFSGSDFPVGRLAESPDGRLYGVTQYGTNGHGTVYAITVSSLRRSARARRAG